MSGGQYRPLSESDIRRINDTALMILGNIDPSQDLLGGTGCIHDREHNRIRFPRALVEDLIAEAAKEYVMYGVDPCHDQEIKGERVIFSTSGEGISILDFSSRHYRPSTLVDLYDAARLAIISEHHAFGQTFIARSEGTCHCTTSTSPRATRGHQQAFALGIAMADNVDTIIAMLTLRPQGAFSNGHLSVVARSSAALRETTRGADQDGKTWADGRYRGRGASEATALAAPVPWHRLCRTLAACVTNLIRPGSALNRHGRSYRTCAPVRSAGGSGEEALVTRPLPRSATTTA
jgi:hypothetical protein